MKRYLWVVLIILILFLINITNLFGSVYKIINTNVNYKYESHKFCKYLYLNGMSEYFYGVAKWDFNSSSQYNYGTLNIENTKDYGFLKALNLNYSISNHSLHTLSSQNLEIYWENDNGLTYFENLYGHCIKINKWLIIKSNSEFFLGFASAPSIEENNKWGIGINQNFSLYLTPNYNYYNDISTSNLNLFDSNVFNKYKEKSRIMNNSISDKVIRAKNIFLKDIDNKKYYHSFNSNDGFNFLDHDYGSTPWNFVHRPQFAAGIACGPLDESAYPNYNENLIFNSYGNSNRTAMITSNIGPDVSNKNFYSKLYQDRNHPDAINWGIDSTYDSSFNYTDNSNPICITNLYDSNNWLLQIINMYIYVRSWYESIMNTKSNYLINPVLGKDANGSEIHLTDLMIKIIKNIDELVILQPYVQFDNIKYDSNLKAGETLETVFQSLLSVASFASRFIPNSEISFFVGIAIKLLQLGSAAIFTQESAWEPKNDSSFYLDTSNINYMSSVLEIFYQKYFKDKYKVDAKTGKPINIYRVDNYKISLDNWKASMKWHSNFVLGFNTMYSVSSGFTYLDFSNVELNMSLNYSHIKI